MIVLFLFQGFSGVTAASAPSQQALPGRSTEGRAELEDNAAGPKRDGGVVVVQGVRGRSANTFENPASGGSSSKRIKQTPQAIMGAVDRNKCSYLSATPL